MSLVNDHHDRENNDGELSDANAPENVSPVAIARNEYNADFIVISGHIGRDLARKLIAALESREDGCRPHVCLS